MRSIIPENRRRPFVLKNIGELYLKMGEPRKALGALLAGARLDPSNHNAQFLLGEALERVGQKKAALAAYERAVDIMVERYAKPFPEAEKCVERLEAEMPCDAEPAIVNSPSQDEEGQTGLVDMYNVARGFGFIRSGAARVFFHISNVEDHLVPIQGMTVRYVAGTSPKGPIAKHVRRVERDPHSTG